MMEHFGHLWPQSGMIIFLPQRLPFTISINDVRRDVGSTPRWRLGLGHQPPHQYISC
jgi:hypothetical protein